MIPATKFITKMDTMIAYNKWFMVGFSLFAGLVSAGCANEDGPDETITDTLSFSWQEGQDREVQFHAILSGCHGEDRSCYSVVELDLDSEDHTGRSTAGDLTEQQLEALGALLTPDQLDHYEEDQDPSCEDDGDLKYTLLYDDAEGKYHYYCLVSGDHLSPETENAIEVLTVLSEKLLKEGTPVKDKN